jgi:hypothetical protein
VLEEPDPIRRELLDDGISRREHDGTAAKDECHLRLPRQKAQGYIEETYAARDRDEQESHKRPKESSHRV